MAFVGLLLCCSEMEFAAPYICRGGGDWGSAMKCLCRSGRRSQSRRDTRFGSRKRVKERTRGDDLSCIGLSYAAPGVELEGIFIFYNVWRVFLVHE
ncbi:hypothetical protein SLA2020_354540 [Shorea laevis]